MIRGRSIQHNHLYSKLMASLFSLFGVTLICFFLFHWAGGEPASQMAGKYATTENISSIKAELHLDKPLISQYLLFVRQSLLFDWGTSWQTRQSVNQMIFSSLGASLMLTLPSFLVSILLSLGFALWSTRWRFSGRDKTVVLSCLSLMSISFLTYIISLQYLLAFRLGWFPVSGWDPARLSPLYSLSLPWLILVVVSLGPNTLRFRSILIPLAELDYITTARAKGVSLWRLYVRHLLKNGLAPIGAVVFSQLPFVFMGSLLLEAYFAIPGIGGLLIEAMHNADFPVVKAMTVLGAVVYLTVNVLADSFYQWIDPRVDL